uniref:Gamma-conotoxin-like TxVIIA n=1 Tax=Lygus hesperus TaxID=30085 RepID=A0A0A9WYX8_LYGHE
MWKLSSSQFCSLLRELRLCLRARYGWINPPSLSHGRQRDCSQYTSYCETDSRGSHQELRRPSYTQTPVRDAVPTGSFLSLYWDRTVLFPNTVGQPPVTGPSQGPV